MSDIIHLLPDSVANQIAAGEVIQRPASVIKELVENAIDAEAKNIQILVTDSGRTTIQVIDDGKGMSETDARLAFERHATSKISKAADLFALRTMGFRGEALASIAAVAHVTLRTRMEANELGTEITLAGSKVEKQEVVSCSKGSNFIVNDLFFNVPARRKFLKSNATELNNIITEFERIVLVHPDIAFSLRSNGTELYHLPSASFRQRIAAVFGRKTDQQLLPLDVETSLVRVSGFIGQPQSAVKHGNKQFFFVNGRYMRHPYFHKAVMEGFNHLIPADVQISYFLYFEVDPADIDVNIHPTKTEIKFENETSIWQILLAAVKESLSKFNAMPSIDFDTEGLPEIPVYEKQSSTSAPSEMPKVHINTEYNPFNSGQQTDYKRQNIDWQTLYRGSSSSTELPSLDEEEKSKILPSLYNDESATSAKSVEQMQIKGRYIITSIKSGLMVIDQRRAHIRILYERYKEQLTQHSGISQRVLFPDVIQLTPSEVNMLLQMMEQLEALGFDLADLGGGSYSINGVPSDTQGIKPTELVHEMIHSALEETGNVKQELQHTLSLSLARSAAIVYGQVLSSTEMSTLIEGLFACSNSSLTPDGKTILTVIKEDEIDKRFE